MFVENAQTPLAVSTPTPRFSWEVALEGRARHQTAYHILVATCKDLLTPGRADLWDSGKISSNQSTHIPYTGRPLASNQDCYWTMQLWDETDHPSGFAAPQYFGTALFAQVDWHGQWIGLGPQQEPRLDPWAMRPDDASGLSLSADDIARQSQEIRDLNPDPHAPLLRKAFTLAHPITRARAFICGLGLFELRINGEKIGEDVLTTPRTDFRKRVYYTTYDVTRNLACGENAVGIILGNGWFNAQKKYWHWQAPWFGSPRALFQLEVTFADGSKQRLVSDESWQGHESPIGLNCIYDGEDYDARLEQPGWDTSQFAATGWRAVNRVAPPGGKLVALDHEPNRVVERFRPVQFSEPEPGVFVYDMGKVMTGWAKVTMLQGVAGQTLRLRYAELQHANGMINTSTAGGARQADHYTMRGDAGESYEPRFTYHGFRYVEVSGFPGTPDLDSLEACFVYNAVAKAGTFECAHDLINKIHRCTLQSQRCNLQMGVPTDDTQREERLGWCGDAWSFAEECFYNLDTPRFWAKWIADFYDQQHEELGVVGYITPLPGFGEDLVWSAAFILIPWWHYTHYGDRRILETSYPYLKKYMAYLQRVGEKEIPPLPSGQVAKALFPERSREARFPAPEDRGHLQRSLFGDHLATHEGSSGFCKDHPRSMATAFYAYDATIMSRIAQTLGHADDAREYQELASEITRAYNDCFFDPNLGYYDVGCQSAQALPLAFDLVPAPHRQRLTSYLNSSVNFRQRRITTGYAGTKWLVHAIARSGRNDILWNRAIATDYPSWGYMLHDDKTTITENWAGAASQSHTTLGAAIDEWFYSGLAGIRPDESAPGYESIIFQPYLPPELPWARASLKTLRGTIVSAWQQHDGTAKLKIAVPANCRGTVHIPAAAADISEGDSAACQADGVQLLSERDGETRYAVQSGSYCFTFPVQL